MLDTYVDNGLNKNPTNCVVTIRKLNLNWGKNVLCPIQLIWLQLWFAFYWFQCSVFWGICLFASINNCSSFKNWECFCLIYSLKIGALILARFLFSYFRPLESYLSLLCFVVAAAAALNTFCFFLLQLKWITKSINSKANWTQN